MTIVKGQLETLKKLRSVLHDSGLTEFESIGQINEFQQRYEAEVNNLPNLVERELEAEINKTRATCTALQSQLDGLTARLRSKHTSAVHLLEQKIDLRAASASGNPFLRFKSMVQRNFYSLKKRRLEKNLEKATKEQTKEVSTELLIAQKELRYLTSDKQALLSKRTKEKLDKLKHTKLVLDDLYPIIAGAIGEHAVLKTLNNLSDDYYLVNDYSVNFDPPIFNKKDNDRIISIQIDHLLVCGSGVFLLETKNWNNSSIENLDLRSPVDQIRRTSYALFTLLNGGSMSRGLRLRKHHWGAKKVPIRNIIVMTNAKPNIEFKHVKVLSLKELIGYIQFFDPIFSVDEVESIFEYLMEASL